MIIKNCNAKWLLRGFVAAAVLLMAGGSSVACAADPRDAAPPEQTPEAVKKVIAFDKSGKKADKPYRIGYLTECATNTYCETRLKALQDAADKYGFTFKVFDA